MFDRRWRPIFELDPDQIVLALTISDIRWPFVTEEPAGNPIIVDGDSWREQANKQIVCLHDEADMAGFVAAGNMADPEFEEVQFTGDEEVSNQGLT